MLQLMRCGCSLQNRWPEPEIMIHLTMSEGADVKRHLNETTAHEHAHLSVVTVAYMPRTIAAARL